MFIRIVAFLMHILGFGEAAFRIWEKHQDKMEGKVEQERDDIKAALKVSEAVRKASDAAPVSNEAMKELLRNGRL